MATRHEITSIQFKADAGKANAAIDSIRQKAKEANDQMTQLRQKLEEGRKANLPIEDLKKMEDQLKSATKEAKQWSDAQRNLMRGVKALDEAIIQFNRGQGSVEKMSAALSKAARNAAQLQQSRMERGSQGWQEMGALITALDKNLVKARQDFDGLVQTIEAGGRVSVSELTQAKQSLKELSDLTAYGSDEWKGYQAQLATISKHFDSLSIAERRLAGEIVTVEDARKRAAAADAEAAQKRAENARLVHLQAVLNAEDAQKREADSRRQIAATEQEIAKTKEQVAAQKQLIASLNELSDAEDKAGKEVDEARKKMNKAEEEWKPVREAAWDAAKKVVELEAKLKELEEQGSTPKGNATLEQLKQEAEAATAKVEEARKKLAEIQGRSFSESPRAKELQAEIDKLQELIDVSEKYRKQFSKMSDAAFEKGYMGKEGMADDERKSVYRAQSYLERAYRDRLKASVADAVPKDQEDYPEYQAAAKRVAGGIVQNAQENFRRAMFTEIQNGELTSTRMEEEIQHYRLMMEQAGREAQGQPGGLRDDPEYNRYKFMIAQMEKYIEVARQVEAERRKIAGSEHFIEAARTDVMNDKFGEGFVNQQANRMIAQVSSDSQAQRKEEERIATVELTEAQNKEREAVARLNEAQQQSVSTDQQKAELQQQLAEAQTKLNEAKAAAEGPTKALKEAEEAYAEAEKKEQEATDALNKARENTNLGEEEQKLEALERKYDGLTESLQKQKEAQTALADTRQKEQEAAIELAQAQNQSEEGLKKSVEILEQQNKTLEAGSTEWQENEQAIGKLNKRIEELKQQSQELRGEVMSLAEAEELADKAMEEQALTTKTGWAASTEELKRAEQTLAEKVAKAKRGTAEEEAAYQKLVRQLQAVRTELSAGSMSGKQMMAVLKDPKNVTSVDTLKAAIGRARQELDVLGRRLDQAKQSGQSGEVKKLQKTYDDLAKSVQQTDIRMKELQNSSKGTASAFDKAWSRLKTYVGLYVGAAVAMQKLTAAMGDLMTLSDKMGEVRKTTGFTADEVGRLSGNLAKLDTRTTLTSLMELSSLAGSVGLKTQQDVQGFTEAADQLIVALPELGNESARTIIKIANATGDLEKNGGNVRETLEKVGSTIIALRANSASAAGPITDFVSRVGAVGAQAGISIDQIAALGSTIDALGGRVEMSATALSRMIPAIKNNSFAIANSIGVTEKYLKSLAPMEQMVLIFQKMRDNIAGIDTSTEQGQEQMAATIEGMLGKNATMREVMKDLEQQGARAGIVFGLLSQNVDELEKQLGIASEAYRENTALANEFNNMNETTAAKWERLKNQLEEAFVGDKAQRWLGWIIDRLRVVVDLLTGDGGVSIALRTILIYMTALRLKLADVAAGGLKALWTGIKNIGVALGFVKGELTKMQMANIFTALAAAALYAYHAFKQWHEETMAAAREAAQFEAELQKEQAKVEDLTKAVAKASVNVDDARAAVEKARKELDEAKKSADGSKESTERLTKAEKDLFDAENNLRKAQDDHTRSIQQINSQYGKYLGFMLSEVSSAEELAAARELINDKLRETINLKRKEAALGRIEESMGEGRDDRYADLSDLVSRGATSKDSNGNRIRDPKKAARIMTDITKAAQQEYATAQDFTKAVYKILSQEGYVGDMWDAWKSNIAAKAQLYYKEVANIRKKNNEIEQQFAGEDAANRERSQKDLERQYKAAEKNYTTLEGEYAKATGNARKKAAANLLKQMDTINEMVDNSANYYDLTDKDEKASYDRFVAGNEERIKGMQEQREALLKEAGEAYSARKRVGGGSTVPNPTNPYGTYNRVTSPYQDWDADALVSRRKEMLERVRALANGADVQAVLSEDAKFITEATRNNIKTTRDAIEWYNTERLKIQEALHEKHLTNTGDWMDPTGRKKREKTIKDEWSAYLNDLDAYYTERKTRIQEAATEEGITEAEMKNRTLANEMEWHQRRAELQKLYARKSGEVTEEEQQAIFDILSERTGDTADFIQKTIGKTVKFIYDIGQHSEAEMRSIFGKLDKGIERDFLKQQQAVTTQMKAICDIIEKERPYDGITRNLRENLVTMGILTADMTAERNRLMRENADMSDFNSRQAAEELKRTAFMLGEAENAYSTTIEEVMRHMGEQGMQAWADAIRGDTQMQQALMAQLRTAYDEIQNAIKKEASLIKKQTDIWWADIAEGQTQSRRDGFEQALSRLGLAEDQVKRANSLIGAGQTSERVADKLAIKQMQVRLAMQMTYYNRMRQIGEERIAQLKAEGRLEDAEHLRRSLNLAKTEELKKLEEQRVAIANQMEESQNRLYTALREWGDLVASSLQGVFEASNTGQKEFYTEQAKKRLTGESTSGLYIVVENAGTADAKASYQTLSDQEVLDIEQRNAMADAWKKLMDDLNMKMSETITDQLNAMAQNVSIDANTDALYANTQAILGLTGAMGGDAAAGIDTSLGSSFGVGTSGEGGSTAGSGGGPNTPPAVSDADPESYERYAKWVETYNAGQESMGQKTKDTNTKIQQSTQSAFAKMTAAANLYGVAYQVMSNSNMSASQKAGMIAIQAAGNAAITGLNVAMSEAAARAATDSPGVLGKLWKTLGPVGASAMFAVFTGLLGGLMGLATSKIQKSKSEVAQATGVSVGAGRLATGMLTYAEGNVNEFTDPSTLREGRQYNVDAADGKTYRARYMGRNPRTHLTNGPEFHLSGERGREMIIDAGTTRQITMNEAEIWHAIQTLSGGGSVRRLARRGRGVRAFADGNLSEFADYSEYSESAASPSFDPAAMQASLDRNSAVQEALLERLQQPIQAEVSPYGPRGIVAGYDKAKKDAQRYGVKY